MRLSKFKMLSLAMLASLFLTPVTDALASSTNNASAGFTSGSLSITPMADMSFPSTQITGSTITIHPTTVGSMSLGDSRGTGAGWHVTVSASQFTETAPGGGFAGGTSALTLPTGSFTLDNSGATVAQSGTTSPVPTFLAGAPWSIDAGTPVSVLSAATNAGMGNYTVQFQASNFTLTVSPATKVVDSTNYPSTSTPYSSVITWNIVSGP